LAELLALQDCGSLQALELQKFWLHGSSTSVKQIQ
jgi:hypothetical protein